MRRGKIKHPDVPQKKYCSGWWARRTNHICVNIDCGYSTRSDCSECPHCKSMVICVGWNHGIPAKGSRKWKDYFANTILPLYEKKLESIRQKKVDYQPSDQGETVR